MSSIRSKFEFKDTVQVKPGVLDPDFGTNIEGWSGEIEEIIRREDRSWLYGIAWDRATLQKVDHDYISKCEKENLDFEKIYLDENGLELSNAIEPATDCVRNSAAVA